MRHLGPLALFAALAIGWTWPLAGHLHGAVPGGPGDNYSFLWNLWWMRHVIATPGLAYFHTTYLFHPFGTSIANHPHTALPAIVAATLLGRASIVTAQNLLLLAYVFANLAAMYALVCDIGRDRRTAVLGAVIFGLSPYLASHLLGHFDLMAAWVLPLFALFVRRAMRDGSVASTTAAALVLIATAYTTYYYVVYLFFFLAVYSIAVLDWRPVGWRSSSPSPGARRLRYALSALMIGLAASALWMMVTGGRTVTFGDIAVPMHAPQNALTGVWVCAIAYALSLRRPVLTHALLPRARARRIAVVATGVAGVFAIGATPLLWEALQLIGRGEYVSQEYAWRSVPRGVDLLAPLLGHPLHPLMAAASTRAYTALGQNTIEAVGWLGIVPIALLLVNRHASPGGAQREARVWRIVAIAFAIFAFGPFLTIGGFDTGAKLPAIALRYLPFVANARMPGRAIVGVYLALGVLVAMSLQASTGRLRSPAIQWLLIILVAFEYWDAPIPLTPLQQPAVYSALAAAPAGAVCEVPFGIGDGLSVGVGSQDRAILYYATLHEHPLAGGYIGRMPVDAAERYRRLPLTAALLRLSGDSAAASSARGSEPPPCRYLVVDRQSSSSELLDYVARLPTKHMASDDRRDLYQLR
jgi:hypothetical protein